MSSRSFVRRGATAAVALVGVVWACGPLTGRAESPASRAADEQAIRTAATRYAAALAAGDQAALAALWLPDGDIVDDAGTVIPARETFAGAGGPGPRPTVKVTETNLRFLSADTAIEDGSVEVTLPGGSPPIEGRFSATWVRHEGAWKLGALREARAVVPEGAAALEDLAWMVGEWRLEEPAREPGLGPTQQRLPVTVSVRWNPSRTFLIRDVELLAASAGGRTSTLEITQWIGWDPLSREIHSWAFSTDGTVAEGSWTRDGTTWVARTQTVRQDGSQTSALNFYSFDGTNRCQWRSVPTHIGGEHLPQINLTFVRTPSPEDDRR